jgi:hypothetical protein
MSAFYGAAANSREQYYTSKIPTSCRSGNRLQECGATGTIANEVLEAAVEPGHRAVTESLNRKHN